MREDIDQLVARHKQLSSRKDGLEKDIDYLNAELSARKRSLKKLMDAAREAGYDPNNLRADLQKKVEILRVKLDNWEADIEAGEKMVRPMLEEIRKG